MENQTQFSFNISLSVLNHLGRNLYRNFMTVLGEAISNSWDADAKNVWIYLNKETRSLIIKDDGDGMDDAEFQGRFLKIGYSKRKSGSIKTGGRNRPYIGRKGIGKLALLSCADKISVITKKEGGEYVGGVIDNSGLDKAITDDLTPQEYPLGDVNLSVFKPYTKGHEKGTIIYFENIKDGIRNTIDYLKQMIALNFRFSLVDNSFTIHFNGEPITIDQLEFLTRNTQFLWNINNSSDPLIEKILKEASKQRNSNIEADGAIKGFIASVIKPSQLKVTGTDEKATIDLFVNGRLREKDILKHIPTARLVENYLYGQIHYDSLDDSTDRFTSSREGVVADDALFMGFLQKFRSILDVIIEDWDKWRVELRQEGDSANTRISTKSRKSQELFTAVADEYKQDPGSPNEDKVEGWINMLAPEAAFNFSSYAECFICENLIRLYIDDKKIPLSPEAQKLIDKWKESEIRFKNIGNLSIEIRANKSETTYLSMNDLAYMVDMKNKSTPEDGANLSRDADQYKPIRDAMAHTSLLTSDAKSKLTSVYDNIKARLRALLASP